MPQGWWNKTGGHRSPCDLVRSFLAAVFRQFATAFFLIIFFSKKRKISKDMGFGPNDMFHDMFVH
jgi:hypothetical protein